MAGLREVELVCGDCGEEFTTSVPDNAETSQLAAHDKYDSCEMQLYDIPDE